MSEDESSNNKVSVVSFNDVTSQSLCNASNVESEKNVQQLLNKILGLENEIVGLRRAIPQIQDLNGKEITNDLINQYGKIGELEKKIEYWETECALKDQILSRTCQKFNYQIEQKDAKIQKISKCAKILEEENLKLREQIESDQSKLCGLNEKIHNDCQNNNLLVKVKNNFDENINNNAQLEKTINDLKLEILAKNAQIYDMEIIIEQQNHTIQTILNTNVQATIKNISKLQENANNSINPEYIIKNSLNLLELLNKNVFEINEIKKEIYQLLRKYGYEKNFDDLDKNYLNNLYTKQRKAIHKNNVWLQNEIKKLGNSSLDNYLDELNADSIASSLASNSFEAFKEQSECDLSDIEVSFTQFTNLTNAQIFDKTNEVNDDLEKLTNKMVFLEQLCQKLFQKLQSTAKFLGKVLEQLGESKEDQSILQNINAIKIDLNQSMDEANFVKKNIQKAEKKLTEFQSFFNQPFYNFDQKNEIKDVKTNSAIENEYENLKTKFSIELKIKNELNQKISFLSDLLQKKEEKILQLTNQTKELDNNIQTNQKQIKLLQNSLEELSKKLKESETNQKNYDQILKKYNLVNEDLEKKNSFNQELHQEITFLRKTNKENLFSYNELKKKLAKQADDYNTLQAKYCLFEENNKKKENIIVKLKKEKFLIYQSKIKLQKEFDKLEKCYKKQNDAYCEADKFITKANKLLKEKISNGIIIEETENSISEKFDVENEGIINLKEFFEFLIDCKERSKKIVQILKKSDETLKKINKIEIENSNRVLHLELEVPYLKNLLTEARAMRSMFHLISRFFESQKENFNEKNTKKIRREIRIELKKIYETLAITKHTPR